MIFRNYCTNLAKDNAALIFLIVVTGVLAALLEGVTLGVAVPILTVSSSAGSSLPPLFHSVDFLFAQMDIFARIRVVALILIIVTLIKGLLLYLNNLYSCRFQVLTVKFFRIKIFDQIMNVGMSYINKQHKGHIQSTAVISTNMVGHLVQAAGVFIPKMFMAVVLLVLLLVLSWPLTLISIVIVSVTTLVMRSLVDRITANSEKFKERTKILSGIMFDHLSGLKITRLFCREKEVSGTLEKEGDLLDHYMFKTTKFQGAVRPLFETFGIICLACILLAASFVVAGRAGSGSIPMVILFMIVFFRLLSPGMAFNEFRSAAARYLPHYFEIVNFLKIEDKPYIKSGNIKKPEIEKGIEFKNVSFQYEETTPLVLKDISFRIPKGKKVGLVGPSGCGKTTITELLLRFYDTTEGCILIDGVDLRDIDLQAWRRNVGVVSQDVFLFHDTVKANILFARTEASEEEMFDAARRAYAHDFILELPRGYDTVVGDRGVLLSGGQRQRLAIARMILAGTGIFVFDEATSALDTESERLVQKALVELSESKTVLTIAHRLSTVASSDLIIVMENGGIIEQGHHEELLQKAGLYKKLVGMQAL